MMESTLPWTVELSRPGEVHDACIYGVTGTIRLLIAEVLDKDEAAMIVRAVNAHDDLLAALKLCQSAIAAMIAPDAIKSTTVLNAFAQATEAEAKASAALAKAGVAS